MTTTTTTIEGDKNDDNNHDEHEDEHEDEDDGRTSTIAMTTTATRSQSNPFSCWFPVCFPGIPGRCGPRVHSTFNTLDPGMQTRDTGCSPPGLGTPVPVYTGHWGHPTEEETKTRPSCGRDLSFT